MVGSTWDRTLTANVFSVFVPWPLVEPKFQIVFSCVYIIIIIIIIIINEKIRVTLSQEP